MDSWAIEAPQQSIHRFGSSVTACNLKAQLYSKLGAAMAVAKYSVNRRAISMNEIAALPTGVVHCVLPDV